MSSALVGYWESRYAGGGHSGEGSRGASAQAKAAYVNGLVEREGITSVVDWGCGDGQQLALLALPSYLGVDVSATAVARCLAQFPERQFLRLDPTSAVAVEVQAELGLSMDVLFHLVVDDDFVAYLARLFGSATRFVCIYSTDHDTEPNGHMRHRHFSGLEISGWRLVDRPTGDPAEPGFYLYAREAP